MPPGVPGSHAGPKVGWIHGVSRNCRRGHLSKPHGVAVKPGFLQVHGFHRSNLICRVLSLFFLCVCVVEFCLVFSWMLSQRILEFF